MRWLILVLALVACSDAADTDDALCADAPVTTYANWGESFIGHNCQPCHGSAVLDRSGAPEEVVFDTEADVWTHAARIRTKALDEQTMPPSSGISESDRTRLDIWLTCDGAPP